MFTNEELLNICYCVIFKRLKVDFLLFIIFTEEGHFRINNTTQSFNNGY